jgi:hypothetical protein
VRNVSLDLHPIQTARGVRSAAGITGLLVALGCAGTATELDSQERPVSQALTLAGSPSSPVTWDGARSLGTVTGATGTPAVTSGCVASYVVFTRVSPSGRYRGAADGDTGISGWDAYGTRSFASSPSLTALPNDCNGLRFMVVGRGAGTGTSSRIYWSNGQVTRGSDFVFNPPVAETTFAQVSSRQFSGSNGYPAVTSSPAGDAYLVFRDGSRIYAHTKAAGSTSWGSEHQAPALPTGWQPVGTPAIEYGFFWGPVTVVVRAQNGSGQTAFFASLYNQGSFRPSSWIELGAPPSGSPAVESDPALEWNDSLFTHTLYYRSGGSFYQTSFFLDEWAHDNVSAKEIIHAAIQPAYDSAPSVNGNVDIEQDRKHWVVGRSGSEIFFSAIQDGDSRLAP